MGGGQAISTALQITGVTGAAAQLSNPLTRAVSYTSNNIDPNNLPDPGTMVNFAIRGIYTYEQYVKWMRNWGYDSSSCENLYRAALATLNPYEYITLYRRGVIDYNQLKVYCKESGVHEDTIEKMLKVTEYFPSPGDLIRFAVRDVYNKDRRAYFGLDEDISYDFLTEVAKAGVSQEQAKNYWAAHWELPSVLQGYEMYQRRVITSDDLDKLMIAQDIMPFWRDKLKAISFNPLTRVDVRRMWSFGVITDFNELVNRYKDIGYNEVDAKALADFTVVYESDEEQGLTRAAIIDAYKKGIITKDELTTYFEGLRYSEKVTAFWIAQADYSKTIAQVEKWSNDIIDKYRLGDIDLTGVKQELVELQLPQEYVNNAIEDLKRSSSAKLKMPTKEDLLNWLDSDVIDDVYFNNRMLLIGYKQEDIVNYLTFYYLKKPERKRKFLEPKIYVGWYAKGFYDLQSFAYTMFDMRIDIKDVFSFLMEIQSSKEELQYFTIENLQMLYENYKRERLQNAQG